ncbi:Uncharacterized protein OS=Sorangium cellulosum (strain So ce56) GN=sce5710 PE=4 SV=1 [Gemmata massiliana]|uniref:SMI1/KNR4 family protein n=1 Tax=Gemmata massiliana TaxID=1210884 RepID=A0A6P2D9S4_9BACT|nr:hypothetical protein [Gemmata massiliana]VTR96240.1 Uncharacterized protein OS=Sorangium cellulosum (strain So ce56) GN=sce5710 PE=4 SV=1 [Gemmata massiliana]
MTEAEWLICSDPAAMLGLLGPHVSARKLRLFGVACCRRTEVASRGALAGRGIDLAERLADGLESGEDLTRLRSDLLYEGFSDFDGFWQKRADMACWHQALAVFNALQDTDRFRAGERRPVLENLQEHHDELLSFALSMARKEAGPGAPPVFDRPDICRPDLTRVWTEAARAVAYYQRPDDCPNVTVVDMLTASETRRRRDDWVSALEADFRFEAEQLTILARDIFGDPFRPVTLDPAWLTSTVVALAEGIYADRAFDRLPILADALEEAGCGDPGVLSHCRGPGTHVRGCWVVDTLLKKNHEHGN